MSRKIYITETDKRKLQKLINEAIQDNIQNEELMSDLIRELDRADVVKKADLPRDVITMDSRVLLVLDGSEEEISLVYPHESDVSDNKISVLSPIGTAILGYREGDTIEWKVPSGVTTIKVKKVLYQPEATESAV
ncbi:MAG: nucleoside diphosphate kinase regulator [Burkholderiales bacterium]